MLLLCEGQGNFTQKKKGGWAQSSVPCGIQTCDIFIIRRLLFCCGGCGPLSDFQCYNSFIVGYWASLVSAAIGTHYDINNVYCWPC